MTAPDKHRSARRHQCSDIAAENVASRPLRVHHITYASRRFARAARLLTWSARRYGIGPTRIYRPSCPLAVDLAARFPEIMGAKRGAGYWLWKPFIIRDALARAADGDLVLYTDAAVVLVVDPGTLLRLANENPIVLFELGPSHPMRKWTKRDCFVGLDADSPRFWDMPQLLSGMQLYRAGNEAREFVEQVCRAIVVPDVLTDAPNVRGRPNFPEFREHRHDQAVLTIVARKTNLPFFPDPSQYGPCAPRPALAPSDDRIERPEASYGQVFDTHRRTRRLLRWYLHRRLVWKS